MGTHAPGLHCPGSSAFWLHQLWCFQFAIFPYFEYDSRTHFLPSCPCLDFTLCLPVLCLPWALFFSAQVPLSSGITALFDQPHEVGKMMCRAYRASIAIAGFVRMASTTWEVGSVRSCVRISCIPGVGKHLPTPYNFASLQAMKAWILSAFCILRWKACYGLLAASVQTWSMDFEVSGGLFA